MQESEKFLLDNPYLACEESVHFLVEFCLGLSIEEHDDLMENVIPLHFLKFTGNIPNMFIMYSRLPTNVG